MSEETKVTKGLVRAREHRGAHRGWESRAAPGAGTCMLNEDTTKSLNTTSNRRNTDHGACTRRWGGIHARCGSEQAGKSVVGVCLRGASCNGQDHNPFFLTRGRRTNTRGIKPRGETNAFRQLIIRVVDVSDTGTATCCLVIAKHRRSHGQNPRVSGIMEELRLISESGGVTVPTRRQIHPPER